MPAAVAVQAVLFDRDGTLVVDVPYNGDPDLLCPMPGAVTALRELRARGVRVGVVSNQSGIGRGLLTTAQVSAVNERLARLLGPFDVVRYCPHVEEDHCRCRKPAPGLVVDALRALGVTADEAALVGDIGSDVEAGTAAGVRSILVPTVETRREEIESAAEVAPDLPTAVAALLGRCDVQ